MPNDNAAFIPHPSTPGKPVMMGKKKRKSTKHKTKKTTKTKRK